MKREPAGTSKGGQFAATWRGYRQPRINQEFRHHLTRAAQIEGPGADPQLVAATAARLRDLESELQPFNEDGFEGRLYSTYQGLSSEDMSEMVREDIRDAERVGLLPSELDYDLAVDGDLIRVTVRGMDDSRALQIHLDYASQKPVLVPTVETEDIERVLEGICGLYSKKEGKRWHRPFAVRFESDLDRAMQRQEDDSSENHQKHQDEIDAILDRVSSEGLQRQWDDKMALESRDFPDE